MNGHIEVRHLGHRFDARRESVEAVRDVSLHVNPGEFVSLIGPSGCGKSTVLNVVAGVRQVQDGSARLDGCAI